MVSIGQHDAVHQTPGARDHRRSATAPPQDRDAGLPQATWFTSTVTRELRPTTTTGRTWFPQPQHFGRSRTALGLLQDRFIQSQVFFGRG